MADVSCPAPGNLRDTRSLPLPTDIDIVLINGQNASDKAMTACCAPNTVNLTSGCFEWCQLPSQYTNTSGARQIAASSFGTCLRLNGESVPIVGTNIKNFAGQLQLSLKMASIIALLVGGLLI
jgi:hypothetical protein